MNTILAEVIAEDTLWAATEFIEEFKEFSHHLLSDLKSLRFKEVDIKEFLKAVVEYYLGLGASYFNIGEEAIKHLQDDIKKNVLQRQLQGLRENLNKLIEIIDKLIPLNSNIYLKSLDIQPDTGGDIV